MRTAVLLLNHGAADRAAGVELFLRNIFSDREIIRLPGGEGLQRGFARLIGRRRAPRVAHLYRYMGGGSPLVGYMHAQAADLAARLPGVDVRIGLRYYPPYIGDALAAAVALGARRVVAFPQYPQYSATTVGSVLAELDRAKGHVAGAAGLDHRVVAPFGADPRYVALLAGRLARTVALGARDPVVVFSAHSVPMRFVEAGDPYPGEVVAQAEAVAVAAGLATWEVGYQSRSGPVRWLEPDTVAVVDRLMEEGARDFVLVPISFVQDHLETLVEADVQLAARIHAAGGTFTRVRPVNATPAFADLGAALVRRVCDDREPGAGAGAE